MIIGDDSLFRCVYCQRSSWSSTIKFYII